MLGLLLDSSHSLGACLGLYQVYLQVKVSYTSETLYLQVRSCLESRYV